MLALLNGCMTMMTLDAAKGVTHQGKNGETVVDKKPTPSAYALLPISVTADAFLAPLWATAMFGAL